MSKNNFENKTFVKIQILQKDMAHALSGLRLWRVESFRRAMSLLNFLIMANTPQLKMIGFARPRSGQTGVAGGKPARRAVRNPRWGNTHNAQHPAGVQQTGCPEAN
ncbi:MAG: hypothetical protein EZS26_000687 [Candidatus Ordinivivax streblomastigis]|uniref:Uncharacterized protein n=1 Tax=Candidatus Ordinivivax streblomastigis TaxID=2540710 RepID=A0A5M8P3X3_9BACT|nr:MAG: hypothetical protein EZS26_000687 [Candidatus Ordinivivax streblomastigis]